MTIRMTESVTNAEYKMGVPSHTFPEGHDNKPVVKVTYSEAMAYAEWLSRETGKRFRLPTEEERKTAEESFEADYSNHPLDECPDVGTFGKNANGVSGLKGTVYDWCLHADDMAKARAVWETPGSVSAESLSQQRSAASLPSPEDIAFAARILAVLDALALDALATP
jgi:formylglycine-generating enzyme required for sulfatase activity